MDFSQIKVKGDANQITRAYMDGILIETKFIDSCVPDTSFNLYGKTFASPIMIAAFSHLDQWHENGMVEMAKGACKADICNWAGMGEEEELENILQTGASTIKIVKPYADRKMVFDRLTHAYKAGALAVGMDIDHSFNRQGEVDEIRGIYMQPVSFEELCSFVKATPLPFIVKGVLSVDDAVKCMEAGVRGILVSHHHGITSYAVPPLMVLPEIVKAVGDKMDIFVDCSIDTVFDAFKALALGAKAVCVGRAVAEPFKAKGADGVCEQVDKMNKQLRATMAKTGAANLSQISKNVLWNGYTERKMMVE